MSTEILVALIGAAATIVTVVITSAQTRRNTDAQLERSQAVTDTKLEELTREVRLHNHFAQRMPVVEEQIKVINHRISDLERKETKA